MSAPEVPTLWHVKWYCSSIPYNVLLELGVSDTQVSIHTITDVELRTGETILNVSPRRVVPVLALPSGEVVKEVGAIVLHLCETFDKEGKMHPLPGQKNRTKFLQGVVYAVAECYRACMDLFLAVWGKSKEEREKDKQKIDDLTIKYNRVLVDHLVQELDSGKKNFYLGDQFSIADIPFAYMLMCAKYADIGLLENKVVADYFERLAERPHYKTLFAEP